MALRVILSGGGDILDLSMRSYTENIILDYAQMHTLPCLEYVGGCNF